MNIRSEPLAHKQIITDLACPICSSTQRTVLFGVRDRFHQISGSFVIVRCACGLRSTLPQPGNIARYYPDTYYAYRPSGTLPFFGHGLKGLLRTIVLRYYYGYTYGSAGPRLPAKGWLALVLQRVIWPLRRQAVLVFGPGPLPPALPDGHALDVGCGNGAWLLKLQSLGWQVEGVEFNSLACEVARAAGLVVYQGSLADAARPSNFYDVVRIWHTLEHVPNPDAELREIARILKPGGRLIIGVPNAGGWLARIWGPLWFDLDVPRHFWHFTAAHLQQLVEHAGFRVDSIGYGFYRGYILLRCLCYWIEERNGYTPQGRARFEQRWNWVREARAAGPIRLLLRLLERTNYLELVAIRPEPV